MIFKRSDELVNLQQLHAKELEAQKKLTELFREQSSEAEKQSEEMKKAVSSMQEMLKSGHDRTFTFVLHQRF